MATILFAIILLTQQELAASIEGSVIRAGTSETVRNAAVILSSGTASQPTQTATTDDSGRFKFTNVPAGTYRVTATHEAYLRAEYGSRGPNRPGTPFQITAAQEMKGLVISMTPTGTIAGNVYSRGGDPVGNATVQLLKPQFIDGRQMLLVSQQVRSNAGGEYRFERSAPGQYFVSALPPEKKSASPSGPVRSSLRTDNEGLYLPVYFPGVTEPDFAAPIDLVPGLFYSGVNLTVIEKEARTIRGRIVTDAAGPQSGVFMTLSARGRRITVAGSSVPRKVSITPDGAFELEGIAPGSYDLVVTLGDGETRLSARTSIEVNDEDVENIALALMPGFDVSGRVTIDDVASSGDDPNMPKVRVQLVHVPYIAQVSPRPVPAQPDGTFSIRNIIPGDYSIQVNTQFDAYVNTARLGSADILTFPVRIDGGNRNDLYVRLNRNVATLDTIVIDEKEDRPADHVQVVLIPEPPNRERVDLYRTGLTDASGRLQMKNVDPGDYKVFAWDHLESGIWQSLDFIRLYDDLGTRFHVGPGARETVNTKLIQVRR